MAQIHIELTEAQARAVVYALSSVTDHQEILCVVFPNAKQRQACMDGMESITGGLAYLEGKRRRKKMNRLARVMGINL